jgi:hypothetical protein
VSGAVGAFEHLFGNISYNLLLVSQLVSQLVFLILRKSLEGLIELYE